MSTFVTKKLASGTWSGASATATLGTVPAGTRWIITSFRVQGRLAVTGGAKVMELRLGDMTLLRRSLTSSTYDFPGEAVPGVYNAAGQGHLDLLESKNKSSNDAGNANNIQAALGAHNSLCLEAAEIAQLFFSGAGTANLDGSWHLDGIEVTI
jgi:hypothetical protein